MRMDLIYLSDSLSNTLTGNAIAAFLLYITAFEVRQIPGGAIWPKVGGRKIQIAMYHQTEPNQVLVVSLEWLYWIKN